MDIVPKSVYLQGMEKEEDQAHRYIKSNARTSTSEENLQKNDVFDVMDRNRNGVKNYQWCK